MLESNSIASLPAAVCNLTNLTTLRLSYNRLGADEGKEGTSANDSNTVSSETADTAAGVTYSVEFEDGDSDPAVPHRCCSSTARLTTSHTVLSAGESVLITWPEVFAGKDHPGVIKCVNKKPICATPPPSAPSLPERLRDMTSLR